MSSGKGQTAEPRQRRRPCQEIPHKRLVEFPDTHVLGDGLEGLRVGPIAEQFVNADECVSPPAELVDQLANVRMHLVLSRTTQVQQEQMPVQAGFGLEI